MDHLRSVLFLSLIFLLQVGPAQAQSKLNFINGEAFVSFDGAWLSVDLPLAAEFQPLVEEAFRNYYVANRHLPANLQKAFAFLVAYPAKEEEFGSLLSDAEAMLRGEGVVRIKGNSQLAIQQSVVNYISRYEFQTIASKRFLETVLRDGWNTEVRYQATIEMRRMVNEWRTFDVDHMLPNTIDPNIKAVLATFKTVGLVAGVLGVIGLEVSEEILLESHEPSVEDLEKLARFTSQLRVDDGGRNRTVEKATAYYILMRLHTLSGEQFTLDFAKVQDGSITKKKAAELISLLGMLDVQEAIATLQLALVARNSAMRSGAIRGMIWRATLVQEAKPETLEMLKISFGNERFPAVFHEAWEHSMTKLKPEEVSWELNELIFRQVLGNSRLTNKQKGQLVGFFLTTYTNLNRTDAIHFLAEEPWKNLLKLAEDASVLVPELAVALEKLNLKMTDEAKQIVGLLVARAVRQHLVEAPESEGTLFGKILDKRHETETKKLSGKTSAKNAPLSKEEIVKAAKGPAKKIGRK